MKAACWLGACPAPRQSVPCGGRRPGTGLPAGPCRSAHLQPEPREHLTLGLQLATLQQLLLGQQPLIQLINARQAVLDRRDYLLLQQGDFLLAIGLLDPGAAQRQPAAAPQDLLNRAQRGFE